jgi:undecaprenyl-diphosphatase
MRPAEGALPLRHALALGLLHGPAELLPVSSSAHTELLPWLAGWPYSRAEGELRKSFEVALHAGAGAALAISLRKQLLEQATSVDRRSTTVLALALAPPALAGWALGGPIERRLGGPRSIAAGLLTGALAVALANGRARAREGEEHGGRRQAQAGAGDGLALGLAQASALIPGVSRNGATLSVARARGFARGEAQSLSWQVGLPVIFGASMLKAVRLRRRALPREQRSALAVGGAGAFLSTLASARVLRGGPEGGRSLLPYSLYRCVLAALVISRVRAQ